MPVAISPKINENIRYLVILDFGSLKGVLIIRTKSRVVQIDKKIEI